MDLSGTWLPDLFPYSSLLGSTGDTFYCQSTASWVLSPCTAQCLFLTGTCYASVTEFLAGCDAPLAVFLRGFQALMPCIMAGLDQRDSYVVSQLQFIMVVQLPGWWSRRAENCGFPQLQFLSRR